MTINTLWKKKYNILLSLSNINAFGIFTGPTKNSSSRFYTFHKHNGVFVAALVLNTSIGDGKHLISGGAVNLSNIFHQLKEKN